MANPISRLLKKLKFWLFEKRDDVYAENPKRRRELHNAYLIQASSVLTGIAVFAIIPLVVWLITVKDFVIIYIIFSAIAAIIYLTVSLHVRHLNKQYEPN
jgi:hypothetical protein